MVVRGELFFAGKCNLSCYYCLRNEIGIKETISKYERLEEWVDVLYENNVKDVTISSFNCEPTAQPEFERILEYISSQGFKIELRTNGYIKPHDMYYYSKFLDTVWVSINGNSKESRKQITGISKEIDYYSIQNYLLPSSSLRASIVVNQYNRHEFPNIIDNLPERMEIVQLRKMYKETSDEEYLPEEEAYNIIKHNIIQEAEKVEGSKFNDYIYHGRIISFWDDVILEEKGIKYFPATETITDAGRIIKPLKEQFNENK